MVQQSTIHKVRIGDYAISRIEEIMPQIPLNILLPRLDPEFLDAHLGWLAPGHYDPETGLAPLSIHSWLLRTQHHTILVDACAGNDKPRVREEQADFANLKTPYLERLQAAGVRPEEVDIVMCTHLHVDHVGWNTRLENDRWVPTFPNAKYLFSKTDYDYWDVTNRVGADPSVNDGPFEDSVLPIVEAGQAELIEGSHEIEDAVVIHQRPGHTPGHINLHIGGGDHRAIFSGDIMHHPIQAYQPNWSSCFCELHEQARQTRHKLLQSCADEPTVLLPAHFAAPHMARVKSDGDGFALDWVSPDQLGGN